MASGQSYFCHSCNTVIPTISSYKCPRCNLGFVEKLSDSSGTSSNSSERDSENGDDLSMVWETIPNGTGNLGNLYQFLVRGRDGSNGNANDRPSSSNRRDNSNSNRNERRLRHETVEHLLAEFLNMSQHDAYVDVNNPIRFLVSNPGDYVWGREGLDTIVTQLFNQMDSSGPPPLAKEKIQELPLVDITEKQVENVQCSVCWDSFRMTDKVRQLPCEHIYHDPCIVPWLQLHGTCPICRKLLSDDSDRINSFTSGERLEAFWRTGTDRRTCFRCNQVGHIARYCPSRWSQGDQQQLHEWGPVPNTTSDSNWTNGGDTAFEISFPASMGDDDEYIDMWDDDYSSFDDPSYYWDINPSNGLRSQTAESSSSISYGTNWDINPSNGLRSQTAESSSSISYGTNQRNGRIVTDRRKRGAQEALTCYYCAQPGHFARECPKKQSDRQSQCMHCFKIGHVSDRCWFAPQNQISYDYGQPCPSSSSGSTGRRSNRNARSHSTYNNRTPSTSARTRNEGVCYRCNRPGHIARNCFLPMRLARERTFRRQPCDTCFSTLHLTEECSWNA